jgi:hypothetical protein
MNKTRWLIPMFGLLFGLVSCWSVARAQDVVLVANKGVKISEIRNSDCARFLPAKKLDMRTAPMPCQ